MDLTAVRLMTLKRFPWITALAALHSRDRHASVASHETVRFAASDAARGHPVIIGTRWASALRCAGCLLFVNLTACTSIGPQRLDQDRLDYVRVISDAGKRQTLFNIVRLRFGEPPTFLALDQVVSGYTLQTTGEASVDFYRSATENNFLGVRG
ncbi:MAG: hypothetical protein AB7O80_26375, partial [Acetobacteraceae bacterium]